MKRWIAVGGSVVLGVGLGLVGLRLAIPGLLASPTPHGLRVGGEPLPDGDPGLELVARLADELAAAPVLVRAPAAGAGDDDELGCLFQTTAGALGVAVDVDATLAEVALAAARARRAELDVPLVLRVDRELAAAELASACGAMLARDPVNAELDIAGHRKIPDRVGAELDVEAGVEAVAAGAWEEGVVTLGTREVQAEVTLATLADIDIGTVLSSYETRFGFTGVGRGRGGNIARAAGLLDGLVLRPGAVVSFNARVGPRTLERGFSYAPEIQGDELTTGVGGGTCQVSSTLHAAAIYGGLRIVERRSHSRPSAYAPLGLDATVAYGVVDLKIENPLPFTVVVHASVPEPTKLRVELLGGKVVDKVEYAYGVSNVQNFVRRIEVRPGLKPGRMFRHQTGTRGMDVNSVVTVTYLDGHKETLQYYSGYRATPEIYYLAEDVDPALLPALPEHAKGVVAKGEAARLALENSDPYAVVDAM
ncbi:MAG: VanW family protein [Polyangiaceae bacterium]|nr:VanW family protein [Polyangiaceae bacterium]